MSPAPPKAVERILRLLIPSACREEVLGDLQESCASSRQYVGEAVRVLPMVIFSRIRRTVDPQVLLMQAIPLYLSFLAAAWYEGKTFLFQGSGLLRLAIPAAWVLFGLMIDNAYAVPGKRSLFKRMMRGLVLGLGFSYLSQLALSFGDRALVLPPWVLFAGSVAGLLFSTAVSFLFPPVTDLRAGAGGPASWLKYTAGPFRIAPGAMLVIKSFWFVLILAFIGGQVGGSALAAAFVLISVLFLILRELRRW